MSEAICTWPSCGHTAKGQCGLRLVFDPVTRSAVRINPPPDLPPTLSAAMGLPEVKALVEAARKMLVAAELREIYHRLPNDKNRIGDPKSPKAKARDAWLKAFRRASSATSLALAAIKEPKT